MRARLCFFLDRPGASVLPGFRQPGAESRHDLRVDRLRGQRIGLQRIRPEPVELLGPVRDHTQLSARLNDRLLGEGREVPAVDAAVDPLPTCFTVQSGEHRYAVDQILGKAPAEDLQKRRQQVGDVHERRALDAGRNRSVWSLYVVTRLCEEDEKPGSMRSMWRACARPSFSIPANM